MNKMTLEAAQQIWEVTHKAVGYKTARKNLLNSWICDPIYIKNIFSLRHNPQLGLLSDEAIRHAQLEKMESLIPFLFSMEAQKVVEIREPGEPQLTLLAKKCRLEEALYLMKEYKTILSQAFGEDSYEDIRIALLDYYRNFVGCLLDQCKKLYQAEYQTARTNAQDYIEANELTFDVNYAEGVMSHFLARPERERSAANLAETIKLFLPDEHDPPGMDRLHLIHFLTESYRDFLLCGWEEFIVDSPCFEREEKAV
ncbi:MAG: hypothetical protein WCL30_04685 [Pseudomonadota bacterium]